MIEVHGKPKKVLRRALLIVGVLGLGALLLPPVRKKLPIPARFAVRPTTGT